MNVMVSKTPLRQVATVRELLSNEQARDQLASVAAAHMGPERMMRLVALAIDKTYNLDKCTPLSVLGALMTCSSLGLEPNTNLGHAYLIPFKNNRKGCYEVQLVIGYRGFIALAHNSGQIAFIDAGVHYESDPVWRYRKGTEQILEHEPGPGTGKKLHAYAVCGIKGGGVVTVCWPWEKLIAHRDQYSKGWQQAVRDGKTAQSPWSTAEDAMAMKTLIRQLTRFMPMSSERLSTAGEIDGARVDYAAYAMNPGAGLSNPDGGEPLAIESDVVAEDEDAGAETPAEQGAASAPARQPVQHEAAPKQQAASDGQAAATAARAKAAAAALKAADPAPAAPAPVEVVDEPAPSIDVAAEIAAEADYRARNLIAAMMADLDETSIGGEGNALALWEGEIEEVKQIAPHLWREVEVWIAARADGE